MAYTVEVSGNVHTGLWWYTILAGDFPVILSPSNYPDSESARKAGLARVRKLHGLAAQSRQETDTEALAVVRL